MLSTSSAASVVEAIFQLSSMHAYAQSGTLQLSSLRNLTLEGHAHCVQ